MKDLARAIFPEGGQNCVNEFLLNVITRLDDEMNALKVKLDKAKSPTLELEFCRNISARTKTSTTCEFCIKESNVDEDLFIIPLEIPEGTATLAECLLFSFDGDHIPEKDSMECDFCEQTVMRRRKHRLLSQPETLLFQVKRVKWNRERVNLAKDSTPINAEEILSVSLISDSNSAADYELVGVICHDGNAEKGHYFSYIKSENKWTKADDDRATVTTREEVLGATNGVTFMYRRL